MAETRKGFFTEEQQDILEKLYKGKGLDETFDGLVIKLADDYGLEQLKKLIPDEHESTIYAVVDVIFEYLKPLVEEEE